MVRPLGDQFEEIGLDVGDMLICESSACPALGIFERGRLIGDAALEHRWKSVGKISICDQPMAQFGSRVLEGHPWL